MLFYLDKDGKFSTYGSQSQEVRTTVPQSLNQKGTEQLLHLQVEIASLEKKLRQIKGGQDLVEIAKANHSKNNPLDFNAFDNLQHIIPSESFEAMRSMMPSVPSKSIEQAKSQLATQRIDTETQLNQSRLALVTLQQSTVPAQPAISFGPPTQFNGLFGGGILQLQQRLNKVPRPGTR